MQVYIYNVLQGIDNAHTVETYFTLGDNKVTGYVQIKHYSYRMKRDMRLSRDFESPSVTFFYCETQRERSYGLVHEETLCNKLVEIIPGHELFKLGAGQVETGPVGVSHRFVFRRTQVGQQGRHLVKRPSAHSFVVPGKIMNNHLTEMINELAKYWEHTIGHTIAVLYKLIYPDLLLDRYWPILSWLFHSSLWRASTLPSLMKDRLWLTESLGGESDAMSKKNLWWRGEGTHSTYTQKIHTRLLTALITNA